MTRSEAGKIESLAQGSSAKDENSSAMKHGTAALRCRIPCLARAFRFPIDAQREC